MAEIVADDDIESRQLPRAGIHHVPPGPCARTPPSATSLKAEDSQIAIAHASLQSGLPDRPERRGSRQWTGQRDPLAQLAQSQGSRPLVVGRGELPAP